MTDETEKRQFLVDIHEETETKQTIQSSPKSGKLLAKCEQCINVSLGNGLSVAHTCMDDESDSEDEIPQVEEEHADPEPQPEASPAEKIESEQEAQPEAKAPEQKEIQLEEPPVKAKIPAEEQKQEPAVEK